MQEESGTKESYFFMIGSSSFHPGKKTLKLTKTNWEKVEVKQNFLVKS